MMWVLVECRVVTGYCMCAVGSWTRYSRTKQSTIKNNRFDPLIHLERWKTCWEMKWWWHSVELGWWWQWILASANASTETSRIDAETTRRISARLPLASNRFTRMALLEKLFDQASETRRGWRGVPRLFKTKRPYWPQLANSYRLARHCLWLHSG